MSIQIFDFENQNIAVEVEGDDHWFNASDVARALGYNDIKQAVSKHVDPEDIRKFDVETSGGVQSVNFVNEPGLYALIFDSQKPEAKRFKRWVTSEVLPSIRKKGGYISKDATRDQLERLVYEHQRQLKGQAEDLRLAKAKAEAAEAAMHKAGGFRFQYYERESIRNRDDAVQATQTSLIHKACFIQQRNAIKRTLDQFIRNTCNVEIPYYQFQMMAKNLEDDLYQILNWLDWKDEALVEDAACGLLSRLGELGLTEIWDYDPKSLRITRPGKKPPYALQP